MPFPGPGAKVRISTETGQWPRWSHRGVELFYWTATQGSATLLSVAMTTSPELVPSAPRESGTDESRSRFALRLLVDREN